MYIGGMDFLLKQTTKIRSRNSVFNATFQIEHVMKSALSIIFYLLNKHVKKIFILNKFFAYFVLDATGGVCGTTAGVVCT